MLNAAFDFYDESYETIEGEKIMSPATNTSHNGIIGRIYISVLIYCESNEDCGHAFTDSIDVHLPDGNIFRPDLTVITRENEKIIDWKGNVNGTPDMVVEVLSRFTKKRDLTIKKDIYERNGVKVYWIVDPFVKSVTVFNLQDGKFQLDDEYIYFDDAEFAELNDREKSEVKFEVPVTIFEGLKIKLAYIFKWCP